jgi:hypothetical protein
LKHVENWNKYIEEGIVRQVGHLQELTLFGFVCRVGSPGVD